MPAGKRKQTADGCSNSKRQRRHHARRFSSKTATLYASTALHQVVCAWKRTRRFVFLMKKLQAPLCSHAVSGQKGA